MSHSDQYGPDDLVQFEVNLDIPAFVRTAVRNKMKRDTILVYLHMVAQTYQATDKMRRFATVAQEEDLTRNEILIWLHLSYGGSMEPRHISRKLRIPPRFVEKALTVLERKALSKTGEHSEMRQHFEITGDMQIFKPVFEYQETTRQMPVTYLSLFTYTLEPVGAMSLTEATTALVKPLDSF